MKRELTEEEKRAIAKEARAFGKEQSVHEPNTELWGMDVFAAGVNYSEGYKACAAQSVSLETYTQAIQSLKSLRQHIESIPFADAVKMMEDSEAAGVVIEQSKSYINE